MGFAQKLANLANKFSSSNIGKLLTLDSNGDLAVVDNAFGLKNRIINGDMRIDQRNNGSPLTVPNAGSSWPVDRFAVFKDSSSGVVTTGRVTSAPTGFTNSLNITIGTAYTPGTSDGLLIRHGVEGLNVSDLGWGTANAQPVVLSFYVSSSVIGTYAVGLGNASNNRSYVATYTVTQANTWQRISLNIPGDTSGTWATDNTAGIYLRWDLGSGSNFSTSSPNSWQGGYYFRTSSTVNLASTSSSGINFTGIQLEAGSIPTAFERRPYGYELTLCKRYFERVDYSWTGYTTTGSGAGPFGYYTVEKRATPSFTNMNFSAVNINGGGVTTPGGSFNPLTTFYFSGTAASTGVFQYTGYVLINAEL